MLILKINATVDLSILTETLHWILSYYLESFSFLYLY